MFVFRRELVSRSGRAMMEPTSGDILSTGLAGDAATASLDRERVIAIDVDGMMW